MRYLDISELRYESHWMQCSMCYYIRARTQLRLRMICLNNLPFQCWCRNFFYPFAFLLYYSLCIYIGYLFRQNFSKINTNYLPETVTGTGKIEEVAMGKNGQKQHWIHYHYMKFKWIWWAVAHAFLVKDNFNNSKVICLS